MKKLLFLFSLTIFLFSCAKKQDETISQATEISGRACESPNLEQVLEAGADAPTYQANINSVGIRNVDANTTNYNTIVANDNTITILCQNTGRSLIIDFSGTTATFTVIP